ncbi:hypothetical protein K2X85_17000 [bacterium]|nr:hypothetical protein [bacterium]
MSGEHPSTVQIHHDRQIEECSDAYEEVKNTTTTASTVGRSSGWTFSPSLDATNLDKKFYGNGEFSQDLDSFAFCHIGLTPTENVAKIKERLLPAVTELEAIRLIVACPRDQRFSKQKKGLWRIHFAAGKPAVIGVTC